MKLKDIIANVDKSESNSEWINLEKIAREFDIHQYINTPDDLRISCYYFFNWYCTDSYVGGRVYFLDDKAIAVSWQEGRKCDEEFSWISQELFDETHKYILSIMESDNQKTINPVNLEEDWGPGHHVVYSSQLLTEKVLFGKHLVPVKVVNKYHHNDEVKDWDKVEIMFFDGTFKKVPMSKILVPYNLNDSK